MADNNTPPKSKNVITKRVKYEQKYKSEYKSEVISKSSAGDSYAFCTICRCDISIAHGGRDDIKKHIGTKKHTVAEAANATQPSIFAFTQPDRSLEVTRAELLFTSFLVEHNIALAAADHAGKLFRNMFPDSEIAKKYSSGRTKTGCMVSELAMSTKLRIADVLSSGSVFSSVATDGSNDSDSKLYPVVIRFQDQLTGRVDCTLLTVPNLTKDSTGENIAGLVDETLTDLGIPWKNCIAFSSDKCNDWTL